MDKSEKSDLCIGLMSGTSIDALDAALVECSAAGVRVCATATLPWESETAAILHRLCTSGPDELETAGRASVAIARHAARLVQLLLGRTGIRAADVMAIGSHGQTVRHRPAAGFSVQLDNGALLAALTGIDAVTDFRAADLAAGGQGAPLTPAFHRKIFAAPGIRRFVLNLGGIANLTVLDEQGNVLAGFDTGPANTLMDLVCRQCTDSGFDQDGRLAAAGVVLSDLASKLRDHPYLKLSPPKSTGREDFNEATISEWLTKCRQGLIRTEDLLRTLLEFTVSSACEAIESYLSPKHPQELVLCGGGALNTFAVRRFAEVLADFGVRVRSCRDFGVDPGMLEAQAFAYFAWLCATGRKTDLTYATGAGAPAILGCLYPASCGRLSKVLSSDRV